MLKTSIKSQRPFVVFDPSNGEHRKNFYIFKKINSWANCPYQWIIDDDSIDVVYCITRKLVDYYIQREFIDSQSRKHVIEMNKIQLINNSSIKTTQTG